MKAIALLLVLTSTATTAVASPSVSAAQGAPEVESPQPTRNGDKAELPIELVRGLPTILAKVNGKGPFRFGIDTGQGGYLRVSPELAGQLGLTQVGEVLSSDPSGKNVKRTPLFEAADVTFGPMSYDRVPTSTVTHIRKGVDGIIGMKFFTDLLLTIDYGQKKFIAERGNLPPANGRDVVDLTLDNGIIPSVKVTVGRWSKPAHLDTGNIRFAFFVPEAEVGALPTKGASRSAGTARTVSREIELKAVDLAAPVMVGTTDLRILSVAFPSAGSMGNIGSLALKDMVLTIDFRNRRARISPSSR